MTFRAKPVVRRFQRPSWDTRDRRNFYLNLGFGLAVVAAVVILGIAVAISYYNDHLAPVGSVDGQSITKDDLRDRTAIETWRLQIAQRRVNTQAAAGQLTQAQAELQTQQVDQARQQVIPNSLEKIIDNRIQAKLASDEGVAVTDSDVDAKLLEEATTPESRHAWQIEVKPATDPGATEPTAVSSLPTRPSGSGSSTTLVIWTMPSSRPSAWPTPATRHERIIRWSYMIDPRWGCWARC